MPTNILMPALSPTMEKGNLAKWLKKEGDKVKSGDVIAEIETDKATMEVEAVDEGTLAKIVIPAGTADVPVNQVIAVLAGEGEDVKAASASAASAPPAKPQAQSTPPAAAPAPKPAPQPQAAPMQSAMSAAGARSKRQPHFLLAAGAPTGERRRHRCVAHPGLGPAWPRGRARRRSRAIRQGIESAGRRRPRPPTCRRPDRPTHRCARCSRTAATKSFRMTACAAPSRSG